MRKAATADAEHLSSLNPAIIDNCNIGRTTTNIHHDTGEIIIKIITKASTTDRERLYGNRKEVEAKLGTDLFDGGNMDQRSKGGIELNNHIGTLEADRIADFISVDCDANDCGVN